jgi:uncharacterized surface protein with fasciclin (FAS1) repeats
MMKPNTKISKLIVYSNLKKAFSISSGFVAGTIRPFFLLFVAMITMFSCNDPYENSTYTAYDELPLASYLNTRPDDFSLWVALLQHTNLYNTFNLSTDYTCFVPNNQAMNEYLAAKKVTSVTELDINESVYLIKYHTLHGKVLKQSEFESGSIVWPTATDDRLSIEFREGGINAIYLNKTSRIAELDLAVTNGIIHVIEKVLQPVTNTLYDWINADGYSIMKAAINLTGFQESLKTVGIESPDATGKMVLKRYYYTLFAVSDKTYQSSGINNIDDLLAKLNASNQDYTQPSNPLFKYVAYHILSRISSYSDLALFPNLEISKNVNTLADKELINIYFYNNTIWINFDRVNNSGISFIENDLACKNGVVHVVDHWMPISTPPATTVEWDIANYADLAAICKYFQSPTPNGGSNKYEREILENEVSAYRWEAVPISRTGVVAYVNSRANDGILYYAKNYDHLRITTGSGGWIEITSPVIVKGKYRITLQYISEFKASNTGQMQLYLDGSKLGSSFFTSNTSQAALKQVILSTSIEFDQTDTHTLRIVGIDGNALLLDYLKFEPTN